MVQISGLSWEFPVVVGPPDRVFELVEVVLTSITFLTMDLAFLTAYAHSCPTDRGMPTHCTRDSSPNPAKLAGQGTHQVYIRPVGYALDLRNMLANTHGSRTVLKIQVVERNHTSSIWRTALWRKYLDTCDIGYLG